MEATRSASWRTPRTPVSVRPGLVMSLLVGLGFGAFAGLVDPDRCSIGSTIGWRRSPSSSITSPRTFSARSRRRKPRARSTCSQPDDARHVFAESYRNVRSSIFFMPYEGPRPKTLLITSAVPNEGKSTVSANLAITMALSGAKTLLIDGDLRRGALRETFRDPFEDWFFGGSEAGSELAGSGGADFASRVFSCCPAAVPSPSRASTSCASRPTPSSRTSIITTITSSSIARRSSPRTTPPVSLRRSTPRFSSSGSPTLPPG